MTSVTRNSPSFFRSILPHRYFWLVLGMIVALAGMMIEGETYLVYLPVFAFGGFWLGLTLGTLAILIQIKGEQPCWALLFAVWTLSLLWAWNWGSMKVSESFIEFQFLFFRGVPLALLFNAFTSLAIRHFGSSWQVVYERVIPQGDSRRLLAMLGVLLAVHVFSRFIQEDIKLVNWAWLKSAIIVSLAWTGIATALVTDYASRIKRVTALLLFSALIFAPTLPLVAILFRNADDFREVNYPAVAIWGGIFLSAWIVLGNSTQRTPSRLHSNSLVLLSIIWPIALAIAVFNFSAPNEKLSVVVEKQLAYNEERLTLWHLRYLVSQGGAIIEVKEDGNAYHSTLTLNGSTPSNILRLMPQKHIGKEFYLKLKSATPAINFKFLPQRCTEVHLIDSEITLSQLFQLQNNYRRLHLASTQVIDDSPPVPSGTFLSKLTLSDLPLESLPIIIKNFSTYGNVWSVHFNQQEWSLECFKELIQLAPRNGILFDLNSDGLRSFNAAFRCLSELDRSEILRHSFQISDLDELEVAPELLLDLLNLNVKRLVITNPTKPDAWQLLLANYQPIRTRLPEWLFEPDPKTGEYPLFSEPSVTELAKKLGWAYGVDGEGSVTRLWLPNERWLLQLTDVELEHLVAVSIDHYWLGSFERIYEPSTNCFERAMSNLSQKSRELTEIHFGELLHKDFEISGDTNFPQVAQIRCLVDVKSNFSISNLLGSCPNLSECWILFFHNDLKITPNFPSRILADLQELRPSGNHRILSTSPKFNPVDSKPLLTLEIQEGLPNTTFLFGSNPQDIVPDDFKAHIAKIREDVVRRLKEMIEQNSEEGQ
ncbi:MAG: hypothetical protein KF851_14560 [Pirellulaceae bacterium]|nr:hypothetical protein [Pirellulaceae bacterium]